MQSLLKSQFPPPFLVEVDKQILKVMWEIQYIEYSQTIFKKNKAGRLTILKLTKKL